MKIYRLRVSGKGVSVLPSARYRGTSIHVNKSILHKLDHGDGAPPPKVFAPEGVGSGLANEAALKEKLSKLSVGTKKHKKINFSI